MSVFNSLRELLEAATQNPNRGGEPTEATGGYWCHDCKERIPATEVEGERTPDCPSCGEDMEFERSAGSTGCAC